MRLTQLPRIARACGLVLVASSLAVAGPVVQASPADAALATGSAPLKIATLNVHTDLTVARALGDISKLADTGADVISLQEMGSRARRDHVRAALIDCEECPFDAFMPLAGAHASIPILFRRDRFEVIETGSRKVSDATYVGPKGAGPSTLKAKFVTYALLYDLQSGQQVAVLNNHAVPSVQASSGGPNTNTARLELYKKHMAGLRAMVIEMAGRGAKVFATGDLNVNYRTDRKVQASIFPYSQMRAVSTQASYVTLGEPARGTHVLQNGFDKRLIDYVFNRKDLAVTPKSQAVLLGYASDHRPLVVSYSVTVDPDSVPPGSEEPVEPEPGEAPPPPADVTASGGNQQATVTWSPPAENADAITHYVVTPSPAGNPVTVPATTTSTSVTGLTNGQSYSFRVAAMNGSVTGPALESNLVVPATVPSKIAKPRVRVVKKRAVIRWSAPRSNGGSPVREYRVVLNGKRFTMSPAARTLTLRNVKRGKYRVRARAVNAVGVAPISDITRFRIRARGGTWTPR